MASKPTNPKPAAATTAPPARPFLRPRMRSYDGIWQTSFRYPPFNLDKLTQESKLYEIADNMLTQGACRSAFNLKRFAIQSDGWEIVPAVTDAFDSRFTVAKEYADFVTWVLSNMASASGYPHDMLTTLFEIGRAMWEGFRVSEILWQYLETGPYAGRYGIAGLSWKHARQTGFDYDPDTQEPLWVTSYTPGASGSGATANQRALDSGSRGGYDFTVPVERCLIYSYLPDAAIINSPGDWRPCYKHWLRIDDNMYRWAKALKRWGSPVIIGNAESNNQKQIDDGVGYLEEIEDGRAALLPANMKFQLAQAGAGVFDGYLKSNQWDEMQIAKCIHGSILTTSEGEHGSTSAGSDVHQDTSETIYGYGRRTQENAITRQVIHRLLTYNIPGYDPDLCPRLSLGGDKSDSILELMQAFDLAINDGVVWKGEKWIRERLGWNPLTPEDQAAQEAEQAEQQKAELEAQKMLADTRNSGQTKALNPVEVDRALALLTMAVKATNYVEAR